jgi:hypothetical protein
MCGSPDHWTKKCPNRKGRKLRPEQKTSNMVASNSGGGTSVYGNLSYVLSVFQSITWWLDSGANVHVCSDALLFSSYQVTQDSSVLMENGSHASVCGVDMIDMKLTSGKIVQLKNVQHGFKVVIESNKFVMLKCGQFIDKCYVCGCLFHFFSF